MKITADDLEGKPAGRVFLGASSVERNRNESFSFIPMGCVEKNTPLACILTKTN